MSTTSANDPVSQSEIEKLLAEVGSGAAPAGEGDNSLLATFGGVLVQRHEFPKVSLFSQSDLRKLRLCQEEFVLNLTAHLSTRLGLEVAVQMAKLETQSFQTFVDAVTNPTHLALFRIESLAGNCVLNIPLRLALSFIDRELGGPGYWKSDPRELTHLESGLITRMVDDILSEWCGVWRQFLDLRPKQIGSETNSRFLEVCEVEETMLILELEVRFGQIAEAMHLAVPSGTLEPVIAKMNATMEKTKKPAQAPAVKAPKWNVGFDDLNLSVTAELPTVTMITTALANLKPGDLIQLTPETIEQVKLLFEGSPKYSGVLGLNGSRLAVKISNALTI